MQEPSEIYAAARLKSIVDKKYIAKRTKLNEAYSLIKSYSELEHGKVTDEIKVKAQSYFYAANGICFYSDINPAQVPDERVQTCVNGIRQNSSQIFLDFYESYKRKIDTGYREEIVNNAYEDLQVSYKLYCLANNLEINPNISIEEIKSMISKINENRIK